MGDDALVAVNKVLLVDDFATQLNIWSRACSDRGKVPLRASHHDEAIEIARRERPELALVDVFLGGRDGLEVASALKRIDPRMHVVVLSGEMTPQLALRAALAGADHAYCKSVLAGPIIDAVQRGVRVQSSGGWLSTEPELWDRLAHLLAARGSRLPPPPPEQDAAIRPLREDLAERALRVINDVYERTGGNEARTARLLKISRRRVSKARKQLRAAEVVRNVTGEDNVRLQV